MIDTNIVEMEILPKAIYKFSAISIKIPTAFYAVMNNLDLKVK